VPAPRGAPSLDDYWIDHPQGLAEVLRVDASNAAA
jgi:hypothetical protein